MTNYDVVQFNGKSSIKPFANDAAAGQYKRDNRLKSVTPR